MVMARSTGHVFAPNNCLLRVDVIAERWVASMLAPNSVVAQQIVGTDEHVHRQIVRWLHRSTMD